MTQSTGTQTRTFTYDANGKVLTAANPETGLVTNTYDSATGLLQQKVDARNNKVTYTYDTYKRVTSIQRYEWVIPSWPPGSPGSYVERAEQMTNFVYDANGDTGFAATNLAGRLAYVETYSKRGGAAWNAPGGGNAWETMTFREMYSYTTAGLMTRKRLKASGRYSPAYPVATDYLESSYTFDSEGRMTGQTYPAAHDLMGTTEVPGVSFAYGFDAMGRPKTMTQGGATTLISDVAYNAASQPTTIAAGVAWVNAESREYNVLGQLRSLTSGVTRFEYDFSGSANDGRITAARTYGNNVLQESINYGYDSLNRLSSANAGAWSATYGYDGFGNLLSTTPSGTGPSAMNGTVDPATNRVNGWTYDANGNVTAMPSFTGTYDIENRLLEATKNSTILYGYGADNRRIYESRRMQVFSNGDTIREDVTYWSGQRIGSYRVRWDGPPNSFVFAKVEENVYFGSKPLKLGSVIAPETYLTVDRLGSIRRSNKDYFPYGQEAPSTTPGDKEKYATYKHDAATDLSYADQRYYATGAGRFMTADPYKASAGVSEPGSWNRYSYVSGDPVNWHDPRGLDQWDPSSNTLTGDPPGPVCMIGGSPVYEPLLCQNAPADAPIGGGAQGPSYQTAAGADGMTITFGVTGNSGPLMNAIQTTAAGLQSVVGAGNDTDCRSFFEGSAIVKEAGGFSGFVGVFTGQSGFSDITTNSSTVINGAHGVPVPGYAILYNILGSFFNRNAPGHSGQDFYRQIAAIRSTSDRSRAFTMLHELAHAAGIIGRDGAGSAAGAGSRNNDAIWKNCQKTIEAFTNHANVN